VGNQYLFGNTYSNRWKHLRQQTHLLQYDSHLVELTKQTGPWTHVIFGLGVGYVVSRLNIGFSTAERELAYSNLLAQKQREVEEDRRNGTLLIYITLTISGTL
jgi:hypothetical protein